MRWSGTEAEDVLVAGDDDGQGLPPHCLSRDPDSGRVVIIIRGRRGFVDYSGHETPESYNHRHRLSYEQIEAMEYGCQLGFDSEFANPVLVRSVRIDMGLAVGPVDPPQRAQRSASAFPPPSPSSPPPSSPPPSSPPLSAPRPVVAGLEPRRRDSELRFLPEFTLGKNGR